MNFRQVAGNTLALCRPCPTRWITLSPWAQAVAHAACCMNYATCSEHATQAAGAVAHNQDKCRSALRKKKREKNTKTKERSLWWWLMVQFLALVSGFSRPLIRLATATATATAPLPASVICLSRWSGISLAIRIGNSWADRIYHWGRAAERFTIAKAVPLDAVLAVPKLSLSFAAFLTLSVSPSQSDELRLYLAAS